MAALRRHPIWRDASDAGLRMLAARTHERRARAGEVLVLAGEPATHVYLLVEGAVRIYHSAERGGGEITVKLFGAPAAFGDAEAIARTRRSESVQALAPVRLLAVDAVRYFQVMQTEARACFRQYFDLGRRFAVTIASEQTANIDSLTARVVAVLLAYAHEFGVVDGRGIVIDYNLTRDDLARQVGATRRSLVRALTALYHSAALGRRGRRYVITDEKRLLEFASRPVSLAMRSGDKPWAEILPSR
jgi:CRP-like cAMP-binding protein